MNFIRQQEQHDYNTKLNIRLPSVLYILIVFTYFRFFMSANCVYFVFFYEIFIENHNLYEKVISIKIIIMNIKQTAVINILKICIL